MEYFAYVSKIKTNRYDQLIVTLLTQRLISMSAIDLNDALYFFH